LDPRNLLKEEQGSLAAVGGLGQHLSERQSGTEEKRRVDESILKGGRRISHTAGWIIPVAIEGGKKRKEAVVLLGTGGNCFARLSAKIHDARRRWLNCSGWEWENKTQKGDLSFMEDKVQQVLKGGDLKKLVPGKKTTIRA